MGKLQLKRGNLLQQIFMILINALWLFGWGLDIDKEVVVSSQGAATIQKGGYL